jgi:hypothetical protein
MPGADNVFGCLQVVCFQDADFPRPPQSDYSDWVETTSWERSKWMPPRSETYGSMVRGTISAPASLTLGMYVSSPRDTHPSAKGQEMHGVCCGANGGFPPG